MSPSTLIRTLCCLILGALAGPALAAPGLLSYQGRMTDSRGLPINTQVTVVFSFFDAPTSGTLLGNGWFDSDSVWPDKNGVYTTMIGDDNNPIPPGIFDSESVYLQVIVNNEFLSPRQRITASPYTINTGHTRTYLAAEAIKAGDVVMATSDGRIKKAKEPGAASYTDINNGSTPFYSFKGLCRLSATRFAAAYQPAGMSNIMLYTVNANGTLTAAKIYFWQGAITSILPLPNGQLLIRYTDSAGSKMLAATPGVDTMTFGSPISTGVVEDWFPLGQDKVVLIQEFSNDMKIDVYSVQNNTISGSLATTWTSGAGITFQTGCGLDDARFAVIGYAGWENNDPTKMNIYTLNGSALQSGGWTLLNRPSGAQLSSVDLNMVDDGKALLYWSTSGLQVVDFTGATPVFGDCVALPSGINGYPVTAWPTAKNLALMSYYHTLRVITINGTSITFGPIKRYASGFGSTGALRFFDATRVLCWSDGSEHYNFHGAACIPLSALDEVLDDWIGVAEETVATGKPCRVTIGGGVTRQFSALKPGRTYLLTPAGLAVANINAVSLLEQGLLIGKALSANELLLK